MSRRLSASARWILALARLSARVFRVVVVLTAMRGRFPAGVRPIGCALAVLILATSISGYAPAAGTCDIVVTSVSANASTGGLVGDVVSVTATVSSTCQIQSVMATASGRSAPLVYSVTDVDPQPIWSGDLSLAGTPRGPFVLTVTATDYALNTASRDIPLVHDTPPAISIDAPTPGSVARPGLHVAATCQDDDPVGCVGLTLTAQPDGGTPVLLPSTTSAIDQDVSLAAFNERAVSLVFAARDSAGQTTSVTRQVYVELNPRFIETVHVPGPVLDDSPTRTLFYDESFQVSLFDKTTNQVTVLNPDLGNSSSPPHPPRGYLTAAGAIFLSAPADSSAIRLYEWRNGTLIDVGHADEDSLRVSGGYAIWTVVSGGNRALFLENLLSGTTVTLDDHVGGFVDVAANGDVVSFTPDYQIIRYRSGVRSPLTSDLTTSHWAPVTDGINVAYSRKPAGVAFGSQASTELITPDGEVTLGQSTAPWLPQPNSDYALNNGWAAFTHPFNGSQNVWVRSPAGTGTQLTFFGDAARISALNDDGRVAITHGGRLLVGQPGGTATEIGKAWQSFWRDGELHVVIGGSVMRVTDCTYALSASGATVGAGASTGALDVTAAPGCSWAAFSNSGFVTVISGSSGTGNGTVSYSVAATNTTSPRAGSLTVAGQPFTIVQAGGTVTASPRALRFGATKAGAAGDLVTVTPAQTVTVTFAGAASGWTASADQPWVQITGGSGSGAGQLTVGIINPGNVLGASQTVISTVTITPATGLAATSVAVTLVITDSTADSTAPFGQVDTPIQDATGVVGALGVTGWALDDLDVTAVQVYRNCLAFDNPLSCQTIGGNSVVYIGDAAFLAGARPDVEAAFPTYPNAYRAGWGFMMLTPMLPHVTGQQRYGGQGPLTLYVYATDLDGHQVLLGRSSDPASPQFQTPTWITMANDTIAKPFGQIDTPAQGATVSGIVNNFGWALTPDTGSAGILIPTDGSTMAIFIDGLPVAQVTYNQCRGSVGNPVPSTLYCDDDVANIFGNTAPQPAGTPRFSNPTRHRNLDAGRAAIGAYQIDTTTMTNGLHTIAWSVTDSASRTEGIGSRFFTVLNGGSSVVTTAAELADAPARVVGEAAALEALMPNAEGVWARTGFDLNGLWKRLAADADGAYATGIAELGRVELWLGAVDGGHLVANGTLRDLPVGSTLDPATGHFAWVPPAGYVGAYTVLFTRGPEKISVTVSIAPRAAPRER